MRSLFLDEHATKDLWRDAAGVQQASLSLGKTVLTFVPIINRYGEEWEQKLETDVANATLRLADAKTDAVLYWDVFRPEEGWYQALVEASEPVIAGKSGLKRRDQLIVPNGFDVLDPIEKMARNRTWLYQNLMVQAREKMARLTADPIGLLETELDLFIQTGKVDEQTPFQEQLNAFLCGFCVGEVKHALPQNLGDPFELLFYGIINNLDDVVQALREEHPDFDVTTQPWPQTA